MNRCCAVIETKSAKSPKPLEHILILIGLIWVVSVHVVYYKGLWERYGLEVVSFVQRVMTLLALAG